MTDERRSGLHEHEEAPESRFETDQDPHADLAEPEADVLEHEPPTATVLATPAGAVEAPPEAEAPPEDAASAAPEAPATPEAPAAPDLSVLDRRPTPGPPREYHFPAFERTRLDNGLTVLACHMPGRPLLAAGLALPGGGAHEPPALAGVTVLTARALTEGTARRDAIGFIEATERLGAEIHADTTWDALVASLEVPRSRFGPALALLAEMLLEPAFPEREVDRLREERINDLLQVRADPRRRAERVFGETIYAPQTPYSRPLAGTETTVPTLDRPAVVERHRDLVGTPGATLIVAGDLTGLSVADLATEHLARWSVADASPPPPDVGPHPAGPRVVLVDRPGAPQSEVRVGHLGLPRRTADFHAVSVLNALLGGTFGSRLNRLLREDRGYTYSISSSFEMRRAAGPFTIRSAVRSEVTVAAVVDILGVVRAMREGEVEERELRTVRDYLVGVFPLRFEAPAQVCAALTGLVVHELPDDELDRYRPRIAAVTETDVLAVAQRHIRPDDMSIVVVGDAAALEAPLREAGLPPLEVIADASAAAEAETVEGG